MEKLNNYLRNLKIKDMKTIANILPIVSITFALLALTSCSDEIVEKVINEDEIHINAVYPSQQARTSSTGFEYGDQIGVFVVQEGSILQPYGNTVNNGRYTYDGYNWTPSRTFYWNEGKHDVYAYYPYIEGVNDTETLLFDISVEQDMENGYWLSDFLWAKAEDQGAGASPVSLKFRHIMSRALVEIVKSDKYEGELPDDMAVVLHNTVTTANVDLKAGGAYKDIYTGAKSIKMHKLSKTLFDAIVVPQNITTRRPIVEVIMGNVSYLMEGMISFKQGYQHTITITITENPQQSEINIGGGIGNWD